MPRALETAQPWDWVGVCDEGEVWEGGDVFGGDGV